VLKKEILISFDKKRDIFVKKNTVLLKKTVKTITLTKYMVMDLDIQQKNRIYQSG